jgi:hypothetical protein
LGTSASHPSIASGRRESLPKGACPLLIEGCRKKRTANKTEKRERRRSRQLAIGNGGRYAGNEQLAVSNEKIDAVIALSALSALAADSRPDSSLLLISHC